jgi:hypothetical protein
MVVNANASQIGRLQSWKMLETRWTAGFLGIKLSREKTITPGAGIHITLFIVSTLFALACRLLRKNEEALLSPVWIRKMRR